MLPYLDLFGKRIEIYGFCLVLAFLAVILASVRQANAKEIPPEDVILVSAAGIGMGLLCGKFLYVLTAYPPETVLERFWDGNVEFLNGGCAPFSGGLLGGLLGAFLASLLARRPLADMEGVIVPCLPIGHAIARAGRILAGTAGVGSGGLGLLLDAAALGYLLHREKRKHRPYDLLFADLGIYALIRLAMGFLRGNGFSGGMAPSQWVSLGTLALCGIRFLILGGRPHPTQET